MKNNISYYADDTDIFIFPLPEHGLNSNLTPLMSIQRGVNRQKCLHFAPIQHKAHVFDLHKNSWFVKSGNAICHYDTKHSHFEQQYPKNTEVGTTKLRQLKSSYESTNKLFVRSMTQQENATEASL